MQTTCMGCNCSFFQTILLADPGLTISEGVKPPTLRKDETGEYIVCGHCGGKNYVTRTKQEGLSFLKLTHFSKT